MISRKKAEFNQECGVSKDLETVNSKINTTILSQFFKILYIFYLTTTCLYIRF